MPYIKITVRDKVATGDRSRIVCGNSDYIAIFDFDAEWDPYDTKTARFVYAEHSGQYVDVVFTGTECPVPVIQDVIGVTVGVFAGDLHTTTPAWFECDKSILCGGGSPAAPPDDVYNQIMELIHGLGTPDEKTIAAAVADYILAHPIQESDPTVPDWAKEGTKPSYTAAEVGADPSGTAAARVSEHNTETTAHSDMRLLIQGLTDRLNALADSDDTTLDQLSEIVAYIKSNRDLISAVTTDKVSVSDIVDNLTTNVATAPLSAAQGVALKALIDAITIPTALPNPNALTFTGAVSGSYDGSAPVSVEIPSGVSEVQSGFELIDSIDWSTEDMAQAGAAKEYTLNGVTEIIIVWQGMANKTQTTSLLGVYLNGSRFSGCGTVITSKAGSTVNGFTYYRCFEGVGTLAIRSPGANSVSSVATNAQIPYSLFSITEKITKLRISNSAGYVANKGITKIYVR